MGVLTSDLLDDWGGGVNTSMELDAVPKGTAVHARNACLVSIGGGKAVYAKRAGLSTLNVTPVTGSTAIVGLHEFRRLTVNASYDPATGGAHVSLPSTTYQLILSENGRLDSISGGVLSTINATFTTSSSSQEYLPDFCNANNLCFIVNGLTAKKFDGSSTTAFGIVAPTTAPTLTDSGVAGSPNGTYEARVTFRSSANLQESSAGTTSGTLAVASKKITWSSIPVSADPQVDSRRLWIRNTATQANFYLAGTISDNTTTTYLSNNADAALTTLGPDTAENNPPPSGIKYLAYHRGRLFAADDSNVYYSKVAPEVESFDPDAVEPVAPDDGHPITGLMSAFDVLIVFKQDATYALIGDDPDTWEMRVIDLTKGAVARRSIVRGHHADRVFMWTEQGPGMLTGQGEIQLIGTPLIQTTLDLLSQDPTYLRKICAAADLLNDRIVWAVPDLSQTRNTRMLPFNERLDKWESDQWDPLDASALATWESSIGQPFVALGGYAGQVFQTDSGDNDGVLASTTMTGTFVASATSHATITDLTAAFDTTGGKLIERKVTITDSTGERVDETTLRPYITANTATVLTLSSTVSGFSIGSTYTYDIGGPAFDLWTPWLPQGDAFSKKRYRFVTLQLRPSTRVNNLRVNLYQSYNIAPGDTSLQEIDVDIEGGVWDTSLWDVGLWDAQQDVPTRLRVGRTGTAILVRLRHFAADVGFIITKIGVSSEILGEMI